MSYEGVYTRDDLKKQRPQHETLVCIDSDGCVFDSMEIKQKQCFHGEIVRQWGLDAIEPLVRETAEFVNLYSVGRGRNRFLSLYDVMVLLKDRPEVAAAGIPLPALPALKRFIDSGVALGNQSLAAEVARTSEPELSAVLAWSETVNQRVEEIASHVPMFPTVPACLEQIRQHTDCLVVSQTPEEALVREWRQNEIDGYVFAIAGQELGTKSEHIAMAMTGRYAPDHVLMIGDAPGDLQAARENGVLFFPINPSREDASWRCFHDEAFAAFLAGTYAGAFEEQLVSEFQALLPGIPPWETIS